MNSHPHVVVFDIDGTLADCSARLPLINTPNVRKDWEAFNERCAEDPVVRPIRALYKAMKEAGYTVVLLTGRSERWRSETEYWLRVNEIDHTNLFMRPMNDYRSDYIVKMELIKERVPLSDIVFAVEDRDRVVRAWREAGVTCLQPCPGDY